MLPLFVPIPHRRAASGPIGLAIAAFVVAGFAGTHALAQASPGLADMLFPKQNAAAPQARSYIVDDRRFTLDRSFPGKPLLKFDGEDEVHALTSVYGARGDEFLRTDTGETLLRITTLGGVTVYGPLGVMGAPADYVSAARPVARPKAPVGGMRTVLARGRKTLAGIVGSPVRLNVPPRLPDATASELLDRVATGLRKGVTAGLGPARAVREVKVVFAAFGGATLRGTTLWIGVSPSQGYAGRPSSAAVLEALKNPAE